jgi:hypothetical protein
MSPRISSPPRARAILIAAAAILPAAPALRAGTHYSHNGVNVNANVTVGNFGQLTDLWWANAFDAAPDGNWVTRLSTTFRSGFAVGSPVSLLIYDDPNDDGDPSDLVLLRQFDTNIKAVDSTRSVFNYYDLPPTHVTGTFFVAALVKNAPANAVINLDRTNPQGRSFLALNGAASAGTFNPANPNAASDPPFALSQANVGGPSPSYDAYVQANARATQYAKAQDPLVIDSFSDGHFTPDTHPGGSNLAAPSALGGIRPVTYSGQVSIADGALSVANGGAITLGYGWRYLNPGFQASLTDALVADLSGYDRLRFRFNSKSGNAFLTMSFVTYVPGASASSSTGSQQINVTPDAAGIFDLNLATAFSQHILGGADFAKIDILSFRLSTALNASLSLDSISLITTPIPGDVNGDDQLTPEDYALLDRGYANQLTGHANGDLTADGVIDANDYVQLDTAYLQQQGGTPSPDFLAQRQSQFGADYVTQLLTAVPEPSVLACLLATLPLARRRSTRSR